MSTHNIQANKIKNKHILVQSALWVTVLFSIFIAINCIATYENFSRLFMSNLKDESNRAKNVAASIIHEYSSLSWLLDYWQKNYETLDLSRQPANKEKYSLLPPEILADPKSLTSEQAELLSPENQKLFAEFCYLGMSSKLDILRDDMQLHSLFFVRNIENKQSFVFYYRDDNTMNEISLGTLFPNDMSKHTTLEKIYITGEDTTEFESIIINNYKLTHRAEELLYDYALLVNKDNGKFIGHLNVSFLGAEKKHEIFLKVMNILILNVLCFAALGIILLFTLDSQILKKLSQVQKNVRIYTDNKDSLLFVNELQKIQSRNEIGRLVDDISTLAVKLEHYTNETSKLSAEKAKIDSELSLAASIQSDALPKEFPDMKKFKLFALLKPAQDIGGDLYDFFMLDNDHIALVIGDVSGKGISAALFMMKVKTELKASALLGNRSPKDIIASLNEKLCDENDAMMFVTLWFGIMNIKTGEIVYVNAGHEYPIIKSDTGMFEINKSRHTPPLAVMPKVKLNEEKLILKPGDTFLIYTDGVPEANNENNEQFGLDKTLDVLNENPDADPEELARALLAKIDDFAGNAPQFDDTTILCVKYFG